MRGGVLSQPIARVAALVVIAFGVVALPVVTAAPAPADPLPAGKARVVLENATVGGTAAFSFITDVPGSPLFSTDTAAANPASQSLDVDPGSYTFIQAAKPGWSLTGLSCDASAVINANLLFLTVSAGQTVTCRFTDTRQGTLVIEKQSVGGTGVFDFTTDSLGSVSIDTSAADPASTSLSVLPGTYRVTETAQPGWVLQSLTCDDPNATVLGAAATYKIGSGQTVTCRWTDSNQAHIVIQTQTVGGTGAFTYITDIPGSPFFQQDTGAANPISQTFDVAPGSYSIIQTAPAGWSLTGLSCDAQGSVVANNLAFISPWVGVTVTCTFVDTNQTTTTTPQPTTTLSPTTTPPTTIGTTTTPATTTTVATTTTPPPTTLATTTTRATTTSRPATTTTRRDRHHHGHHRPDQRYWPRF